VYSRARRPSAWIDELGDGSALDGLDVGGAALLWNGIKTNIKNEIS